MRSADDSDKADPESCSESESDSHKDDESVRYPYEYHPHTLRSFWRALKFLSSTPTTAFAVLMTTAASLHLAEKFLSLPFHELVRQSLSAYRTVFHFPFDFAARHFRIFVGDPFRDIIIAWIALSAAYSRSLQFLHGAIDYVEPPAIGKSRWLAGRSNLFHISGNFVNGLYWRSALWRTISYRANVLFRAWNRVPDSLFGSASAGHMRHALLKGLAVTFWVMPFLPLLIAYVVVFNDMIMSQQWNFFSKDKPIEEYYYQYHDEHSSDLQTVTRYDCELSFRSFFAVQFFSIVAAIALSTSF